jgi:hypothetical protein
MTSIVILKQLSKEIVGNLFLLKNVFFDLFFFFSKKGVWIFHVNKYYYFNKNDQKWN